MSIVFACEHCGKRYEVDASRVGRRGKCSGCGGIMTVPVPVSEPEHPAAAPAQESYDLGAELEFGPSSFTPAPGVGDDELPPPRPRRARTSGVVRRMKQVQPGQFAKWRGPIVGLAVVLAITLAVALAVPKLALVLGGAIVSVGLLLTLGGYAVGTYAAFQEDFVYGIPFLLFPPFTAWYLVTRFDAIKPVVLAIGAGLALCLVGGWAMEYGYVPQAEDTGPEVEIRTPERPVPAPAAPGKARGGR